jgi:diguanylate cyclase (GGDEF)-like protein
MRSQIDAEMQAGLEYIKQILADVKLDLLEHTPLSARQTYAAIGRANRRTDMVLGNRFICNLPRTRPYGIALESYVSAVAGRVRYGNPNVFHCLSGVAIRTEITWPARAGPGETHWLAVNAFDVLLGSVARCTVIIDASLCASSGPTFSQMHLIFNRLRASIDERSISFFKPEEHPIDYQQIELEMPRATPRREVEVQQFLLEKTYVLGFQAAAEVAKVWMADPWDAEYLGVSVEQLSKAAQALRDQGLIDLAPEIAHASPSNKLIAMVQAEFGSPAASSKERTPLSELMGKEQLEKNIGSALERKGGLAVLVVDLDHFKELIEAKGDSEGNVCLERVVKVMAELLGKKGALYRWGGDEFAVLLPDFSTEEACATAERIRRDVEKAKLGGEIAVTASIGVCGSDQVDSPSVQGLLSAANKAMYESKRAGRNRVTTWPIAERQASAATTSQ